MLVDAFLQIGTVVFWSLVALVFLRASVFVLDRRNL